MRLSHIVRSKHFAFIGTCLAVVAALQAAAQSGDAEEYATADAALTLLEVVDAAGSSPTDPSDLLFNGHLGAAAPVFAPDGHQLTLGEFSNVNGSVRAECGDDGTHVNLGLDGLIPHGVYTVWSDYYSSPGLTHDFAHETGLGALGPVDGSQNTFIADAQGSATLNAVQPGGALSWFGEAPPCALDAFDYVLWGVYHIDGQTYGAVPGPPETYVSHFTAMLQKPGVETGVVHWLGDELLTRDDSGQFAGPTQPDDLLFESHSGTNSPVLAPPYELPINQRRQLTLDDWDDAQGTSRVERVEGGTRVTVELEGLVPNGVYTAWADFYLEPGFTWTFENEAAIGPLGAPDGSENGFVASDDGTAKLEAIMPPGPLGWDTFVEGFEAPSHVLDSPMGDFALWFAYHSDGKTWGSLPGPDGFADGTWVGHAFSIIIVKGDFNGNGAVDVGDIDQLSQEVSAGTNNSRLNLDDNPRVSDEDRRVWVEEIANTYFGDANLDGEFNSADMIAVFQVGKYQLDEDAGWADGDWTGDGRFDSTDLIAAFQGGGYELGPRAPMNAVPEPSTAILISTGIVGLLRLRRSRERRQHHSRIVIKGERRHTRCEHRPEDP